jgi:hypothetical protein
MNTAPSAMTTSQSQTLKPSSTPSATVRAMIKVKAATVVQFLTRECDLATPSFPWVDRAVQLGGRGLLPTADWRRGRYAVLADPQGAAFAVFEGETDP